MSQRPAVLPEATELNARLLAVNDIAHYQQHLYPYLLHEAGTTKQVPNGVVFLFVQAVEEYLREQGLPYMMRNALFFEGPEFLDALLPDPADAKAAKEYFQFALTESAKKS